ncbi:MAG: type II toxin-antitoxin system VapC family toxin [Candidatus Eremiobacteraeota bacterium]|nr:type II toxin-antitoxin system VapC family toxin [Candidatus Eremiobacteraeota bacterium]
MKYLLDTCVLIWLTSDPEHLSAAAVQALEDPSARLFVSDASVWELCLKWQSGKMQLPQPPRNWVEDQQKIWSLETAKIERAHLYRMSELPEHHRDPFDRLLIAQAIESGLHILTPDAQIRKYPVAIIW